MCISSGHPEYKFAETHNPVLISLSEHYTGELVTAAQVAKFTLLPKTIVFSKQGHYEWLVLPTGLNPDAALHAVLQLQDSSWTGVFLLGPHITPNAGDAPLFPRLPNRGNGLSSIIIMTTDARISTCYNITGLVLNSIQYKDPIMQTDRATWALGLAVFCHLEGSSSKLTPLVSDEWLDLLDDPQILSARRLRTMSARASNGEPAAQHAWHDMGPPGGTNRRESKGRRSDARQTLSPTWGESPSADGALTPTTSSLSTDSYISAASIMRSIETRFASLQAAQEQQAAVHEEKYSQVQALLIAQHEANLETRQQFVSMMAAFSTRQDVRPNSHNDSI